MNAPVRRLALVGCGRIGGAVMAAWETGELPGWDLVSVLVRDNFHRGERFTEHPAEMLAAEPDLVVELAGPQALASLGRRVLRACELWTISGAALADAALLARLETAGRESGHRLRVLAGAFAGLDGVASLAVGPDAALTLDIELPPGPGAPEDRFRGTVREAAARFPNEVNVAVAAALAGPGLDATRIRVRHPGPVPRHQLALQAESAAGSLAVEVRPLLSRGVHPVACNVIAALRRELQVVWVG